MTSARKGARSIARSAPSSRAVIDEVLGTFADFYRLRIEPALRPAAVITHVTLRGLDGFRSVVRIDDEVLLADHLDGKPLGSDHGAPLRLVSTAQYGHMTGPARSMVTSRVCGWITRHRRVGRKTPARKGISATVLFRTASSSESSATPTFAKRRSGCGTLGDSANAALASSSQRW